MKKILLILGVLSFLGSSAQHNITGTFSPSQDYKWLIAYKLDPGGQNYVADTRITNGEFTLKMPENSILGTYRLVYAVPQEEFYLDVIYNGNEDIVLHFNAEKGISFERSKENKIFNAYFRDINAKEQKIIEFFRAENTETAQFGELIVQLAETQKNYERTSAGMLVNAFIRSNAPYIPAGFESLQEYVKHKKEAYFKALDIGDPVLQASGFLIDKLANYVFTALPVEPMGRSQMEGVMQENVKTLNAHLVRTGQNFRTRLFHTLWTRAANNDLNKTSDHIYDTYLRPLASETGDQEMITKIDIHNRLRSGATAPDIIWKKGNELRKLSALETAQNYLLVFWSSTCSHCLNELPKLHSGLKGNTTIKVIAVGLEDDEVTWKNEAAKLPLFEHAISLGKWESEYANVYDIQQTPTYYILDQDKRILAQPKDYEGVLKFLNEKGQQ